MEPLGALLLKKKGECVVLNKHLGCWELGGECDKSIGKWRPQNRDQSGQGNQPIRLRQMHIWKRKQKPDVQ